MIDLSPARKRKKLILGILISIIVSALCILMIGAGVFEPYELKTFDRMMRYLSKKSGSPDIVVVEIEQNSLDSLKKVHITWPWPRQIYGPIINFLSRSGAKAIFFDILITEPSSYGKEDDEMLAEALKKAGNVYMPFFLSKEVGRAGEQEELFIKRFSLKADKNKKGLIEEFNSVVLPISEVVESVRGMGNIQINPDQDGIYRRIPLLFIYNGGLFPHMCISYLSNNTGGKILLKNNSIWIGDKRIPLENGLFRLNYYGGPRYYNRYSAAEVIQAYTDFEKGLTPILNPELFRDKYVFVGLTAPGLYDLKPTPASSIYPGVEIHATLLDNILRSDYLTRIGKFPLVLLVIVVSILASLMVLVTTSLLRNMVYFAGFITLLLIVGIISFKGNLLLDQVGILFSFTISFAMSALFSYSIEGRQKRQIKKIFSHYMSESLVNEVLKDSENIKLGGEKRVLTVFFSDLQGFTSLSEKRTPEEVVKFLNIYHTAMTDKILSRGGVIDKYQGDGIMAFWGAPVRKDDDEMQACLAALENQESLLELREQLDKVGFPPLYSRIGINTGEMIVGNMGSEKRFDYTVIGDNVNLASRLEEANKLYSTKIIVSESTYIGTKGHFEFRDLDIIRVKGKEGHVRIYELMGRKGGLSNKEIKIRDLFEEGLSLYRNQKWDEAIERFIMCHELDQNDGPAREYIRRCNKILKNPRLTEWDGSYIIEGQ